VFGVSQSSPSDPSTSRVVPPGVGRLDRMGRDAGGRAIATRCSRAGRPGVVGDGGLRRLENGRAAGAAGFEPARARRPRRRTLDRRRARLGPRRGRDPAEVEGRRPLGAHARDPAGDLAEHVARTGRSGDDFLLGTTADAPFSTSYVRKRGRKAWTTAELEPVTLRQLRHAHRSFLDAAGISDARADRYSPERRPTRSRAPRKRCRPNPPSAHLEERLSSLQRLRLETPFPARYPFAVELRAGGPPLIRLPPRSLSPLSRGRRGA
jgi:hypothetical protein